MTEVTAVFFKINSAISSFVWGVPMLAAFLGTGLYLSAKSGFFQIFSAHRWIGSTVVKTLKTRKVKKENDGSVSQFGALMSALAACLGTGNIVGVATAICAGGAGAVFWMCLSAVLGMMTCCCENILGIKYRIKNAADRWSGGPMLYMERGLKMKGLAAIYALFLIAASVGMGNMTQANSVSRALAGFNVSPISCAVLICAVAAFSVLGGLKRITAISEKLIPVLSLAFVSACFVIIAENRQNILPCFKMIMKDAFDLKAVSGFGIAKAARYGISRGVFSNEAGLGSSAIIHSAAECEHPAQQGMWGILEVFIDTVFMCTITAAAILTSGVWSTDSPLNGVELCCAVFESAFGKAGGLFLNGCICLFAFATLIAWSYYGKSSAEYLFGSKGAKIYNLIYPAAAFVGAMTNLEAVWSVSDTFNGLMAIPNIFALLVLSKEALKTLEEYKNIK